MTDVRLTATNPEDSSVVPVACNAKGELLIEEPTLAVEDFVSKTDTASQNIVSDLTLGADKITLDATDGSAEFAGGIKAGMTTSTATGTTMYSVGGLEMKHETSNNTAVITVGKSSSNNGDRNFAVTGDGSVYVGGDLGRPGDGDIVSPNISLNSDGSAEFFGGDVAINSHSNDYRYITLHGETQTSNIAFGVYDRSSSDHVAGINYDGSATFASDVVVGSRNKKWMIVESNGLAHLVEQQEVSVMDDAAKYPELRNIPEELDLIEKALGDVMEKLRMNPPAGWPVWDGSDEI